MQSARDLPEDLALPLRTGAEWWYWLGGRPAVDLVNTLRERWRRRVETLVTPGDLGLWLVQARLAPQAPRVTRALLAEARDLREAIDACMGATLAGASAPLGAAREIDRWLVDVRPRLERHASGALILAEPPPVDSARAALATIALDAARMLG